MTHPAFLRCALPTELLRQIVHDYVTSRWRTEEQAITPRESYKPPWSTIESFSLTCKVIRELVLEAWFEVYFAHSPDDLLHVWPEFSMWTRELHCVELGTDLQVLPVRWNLQSFHRLRKLRVDFSPTQSNAMLPIRFDHPRNIASRIQELELFDISWPSPRSLQIIAQCFPGLRCLKLSQDLIWCDLCYLCRFATFKDHPPSEIMYDKFVGLPSQYATYLAPLVKLQSITLSIAYGLGGATSLSKSNDNMWTGECDACMDLMFDVEDFRKEWLDQKMRMPVLPSLRTVKWQFRHKNTGDVVVDLDGDSLTEDATKFDDSDYDNGTPTDSEARD